MVISYNINLSFEPYCFLVDDDMPIRAPLSPLATSDLHCSETIPASATVKEKIFKCADSGILALGILISLPSVGGRD